MYESFNNIPEEKQGWLEEVGLELVLRVDQQSLRAFLLLFGVHNGVEAEHVEHNSERDEEHEANIRLVGKRVEPKRKRLKGTCKDQVRRVNLDDAHN